jgi:hypothetical protein
MRMFSVESATGFGGGIESNALASDTFELDAFGLDTFELDTLELAAFELGIFAALWSMAFGSFSNGAGAPLGLTVAVELV